MDKTPSAAPPIDGEINKAFSIEDEPLENGRTKQESQIEEFVDEIKKEKPKTKLQIWIRRTIFFLIHVAVGSYFGYATHYFISLSKYSK